MSEQPRIAVLSHSAVEPTYQRKWELLAESGWKVLLVVPTHWPESGRLTRAKPRKSGNLKIEVCRGLLIGRVGDWIPVGIGKRIVRFRPDLVYAEEEPFSIACWRAMRIARSLKVPGAFFTWENVWRRYRWPFSYILPRVLKMAKGAVAGNSKASRILERRGFRGKARVIPQYGFDLGLFRPMSRNSCRRALGWPIAPVIIGYVGRLVPEKGVEILIRAVAKLGKGVSVAIIGSGPCEKDLRQRALDILGEDRAIFAHAVSRDRMPRVFGALNALVLPSLTTKEWKEQFGRVLPEALLCGRWALGSSSGEIPNVLGDRRVVFREGDAADLAGKIENLVMKAGHRGLLSRLRARARKRFSEPAVVEAGRKFFCSLLTRGK